MKIKNYTPLTTEQNRSRYAAVAVTRRAPRYRRRENRDVLCPSSGAEIRISCSGMGSTESCNNKTRKGTY
jgi:hypothetical protein